MGRPTGILELTVPTNPAFNELARFLYRNILQSGI